MYDPLLARFTTPDPLWYKYPGINPWTHCAANPANATDPDGREIFFNTNGAEVLRRGEDKTPYIVLSNKKKTSVIEDAIAKGYYIPLPTSEQMKLMKDAFDFAERDGVEYGFITFANGYNTKLFKGTADDVTFHGSEISVQDTEGSEPAFNVHTHPQLPENSMGRNDRPSATDMDGTKSCLYPSMVLGYETIGVRDFNKIGNNMTYTHVRSIGFYDKSLPREGGKTIYRMKYDSFTNTVKSIYNILK